MILAVCAASFCMALAFSVAECSKISFVLMIIAYVLNAVALISYENLKERIKNLEKKGGGSDA